MSFISKCFKTVLIIAALLFVTSASKYVSFFFSDLFGVLGGAIAGALFLGLVVVKGFSSFRKIWFLKKNTFNQDLNEITQNESDLRIKYEHDNKKKKKNYSKAAQMFTQIIQKSKPALFALKK